MAEKITSINNKMLIWAREESNTTLQVAEQRFENIRKWESGDDYPTYAQLRLLSNFYKKPIAVFFFPEAPVLKSISSSFRTLPTNAFSHIINREITKTINWARVMQLNLYELTDCINPASINLIDCSFNTASINNTAKQLRRLLGASLCEQKRIGKLSSAFEYWRDHFFQIGVFIFKEAFKDDGISGFCLYDDVFPIICVNNSLSYSRQIFTLFHEIYHLIHHTGGIDLLDDTLINSQFNKELEIEQNCNNFASEFLVPDDDFTDVAKHIRTISDQEVEELANLYKVSREVIMRKFLNRKLISNEQYEKNRDKYNKDYLRYAEEEKKKNKDGGYYYPTQLAYKGKHYTELAFRGYYAQKYSITHLANFMGMKVSSVQSIASKKGWGTL